MGTEVRSLSLLPLQADIVQWLNIDVKYRTRLKSQKIKDTGSNVNKGLYGQQVERSIGLKCSNRPLDFVDGELKTFSNRQTVAITCLDVEDVVNNSFKDSKLFKKIGKVLFLCRETSKTKTISMDQSPKLLVELEQQYNNIRSKIIASIEKKEKLRTLNGVNGFSRQGKSDLLQIRTKDASKPTPIVYNGILLSDRKRAFYFTSNFTRMYLHEILV